MSKDTEAAQLEPWVGRFRVTRELPLWQILVVIAGVFWSGVTSYFAQQRLTEELARQGQLQAQMAAELRTITGELQKGTVETVKLNFMVTNLEARVRALENTPAPAPRR